MRRAWCARVRCLRDMLRIAHTAIARTLAHCAAPKLTGAHRARGLAPTAKRAYAPCIACAPRKHMPRRALRAIHMRAYTASCLRKHRRMHRHWLLPFPCFASTIMVTRLVPELLLATTRTSCLKWTAHASTPAPLAPVGAAMTASLDARRLPQHHAFGILRSCCPYLLVQHCAETLPAGLADCRYTSRGEQTRDSASPEFSCTRNGRSCPFNGAAACVRRQHLPSFCWHATIGATTFDYHTETLVVRSSGLPTPAELRIATIWDLIATAAIASICLLVFEPPPSYLRRIL